MTATFFVHADITFAMIYQPYRSWQVKETATTHTALFRFFFFLPIFFSRGARASPFDYVLRGEEGMLRFPPVLLPTFRLHSGHET